MPEDGPQGRARTRQGPQEPATDEGQKGPLVLVVEDDPDMVRFLVRGLSDRYRLATASDGAEGLARALELRPALILTDVLMPRMSGDALVAAARLRPELAKTPIVLMTAKVDDELRVRALQEGAQDYIAKPFLLSELRARVDNLIARRRDEETLAARVAERTAEVEALASRLRALSVELMQSEQRERRRLAAVLHDGLQPVLVGAKLHLSLLRREALSEPGTGAADHLGELLDEAVGITRSLTVALSPPILREAGLAAALEWLVGRMEQQHRFTVEARLDPAAVPPGWRLSEMLFEAARELLFNAVKYSGADRAQLALVRDGDDLCVVVSDEGAGFDPAQVPLGKATAGQFGLFAIQQRLTWLGGRLDIDSVPGRGARVSLRVPLAAGAVPDEPQPRPSANERTRDAIRVLVVDDHPIVREGLVQLLELEPDIAVVGEAENGIEALTLARELTPDVILMDVSMPMMDGVEATRILSRKAPGTPIVALSAHGDGSPAAPMRLAGAVAHVAKGGPTEELLQAIRTFGRKAERPAG